MKKILTNQTMLMKKLFLDFFGSTLCPCFVKAKLLRFSSPTKKNPHLFHIMYGQTGILWTNSRNLLKSCLVSVIFLCFLLPHHNFSRGSVFHPDNVQALLKVIHSPTVNGENHDIHHTTACDVARNRFNGCRTFNIDSKAIK